MAEPRNDTPRNGAAQPQDAPQGMPQSNNPQENKGASHLWRPVVAILAAIAVAFCAWSAWQYAQGSDPLASLGGDALQTVSEPAEGDAQAASAPQITTTSNTVTADDVSSAIAALSFDGQDLGLTSDDAKSVVTPDGIWVEQATTDAAPVMVEAAARRAAALASWAGQQNVGLKAVTWISEDANGTVRLVVRFACDGAPTSGDAAALLSAAQGYAISGNAYAQLGDAPAFAQQGGEAPALPDGAAVSVVENKTVDGENLSKTKTTYRMVDQNGKEVSSKNSASGDEGAEDGAGAAGASSQQGSTITVSITVDGSAAGAGSSSATLTLPAGSTVYDALANCGVGFNAKSTGYGMYVSSIGGLAEKDHGGMSGWVYSVNGAEPNVACSSYVLSGGESIYWSYVNVEY